MPRLSQFIRTTRKDTPRVGNLRAKSPTASPVSRLPTTETRQWPISRTSSASTKPSTRQLRSPSHATAGRSVNPRSVFSRSSDMTSARRWGRSSPPRSAARRVRSSALRFVRFAFATPDAAPQHLLGQFVGLRGSRKELRKVSLVLHCDRGQTLHHRVERLIRKFGAHGPKAGSDLGFELLQSLGCRSRHGQHSEQAACLDTTRLPVIGFRSEVKSTSAALPTYLGGWKIALGL